MRFLRQKQPMRRLKRQLGKPLKHRLLCHMLLELARQRPK